MNNTITIDSSLYNNVSAYAKRHRTSIRHIVENYFIQLIAKDKRPNPKSKEYYISPAVKALESDFKVSGKLSPDYKKEISEYREKKFL